MGSEWEYTTLGECADWYSGGTPRKSCPQYWDGDIPWISAKSLKDFHVQDSEDRVTSEGLENGTRLVPTDAILFVVRGMSLKSEFRLGVAQRPVSFNQDIKAIVAKDDYLPHFLAYILKGKTAEILDLVEEAGHGTGVLPTDVIKNIEIPAISKAEQERLVQIFQAIDDKIELNRRMNATLEGMAQALFKSWFVDFDPVIDNALAAGNPIPDELAPRAEVRRQALADGTANREAAKPFPAAFQETESMGWIPEGWEVASASKHLDALRGFSYKGAGLSNEGVPMHNLNSVREGGGYKYEGIKHYNLEFKKKFLAKPGDVIVANTEQGFDHLLIGFGAMIPKIYAEGFYSHHTYRVRPREDSFLTNHFIFHMFLPGPFRTWVAGFTNGTTVNMLPPAGLSMPLFACPTKALVTAFSEAVAPIYDRIEANIQGSDTLTKIRDTLLPKLISGELSVLEAEQLTDGTLA